MAQSEPRRQTGFTMVELIVVMILIGILGAYVAARLDIRGMEGRNFVDKAAGAIRFAQKLAIAQHRPVYVCLDNRVAVGFDSACTTLATDPGGGSAGLDLSSDTAAIQGTNFSFDREGRPSTGATSITFTVGSDSYTLHIEAETGYVHL